VRAQILERTEGNPLFVEEMTSAVLEHRSDDDGIAIPATLQALITARLDTLDEGTRPTLQLASGIGRSFSEPVLRAVTGDGDALGRQLSTLERVGLIGETARTPEHEYAFRHSLIQEATYGTILLRGRRELHLRVGEALEELYANRMEEFVPLLARHFQEGGDDERVLRYAAGAGDTAARLSANAEAVTHYANAIEAARRLGATDELLGRLYPARGRAFELSGRHEDAEATYVEMRGVADEAGDRAAALRADLALATLYSTPTPRFDAQRGRAVSERTLELARELGDRLAESKSLWNLMLLNVFGGGDLREALEVGERSLAIARELNAREQMAFTLNDLWRPYASVGDLGAARQSLEEATPIWRELGNLPMLSENLASLGTLRWLGGDVAGAFELSQESLRISEEIGNLWGQAYGLMNTAATDRDRGEIGRAIATMRDCIAIAERGGFIPPQATVRADLASILGDLGDLPGAWELVRVALEVATERQPIALPWVIGVRAELHLVAGELDSAEADIAKTQVELLPEPLQSMEHVHLALVRGRIAAAQGDHARAVEIADTVTERLRRLGIRQFVAESLLLKGRSLEAVGDLEGAERVLHEARSEAELLECRRVLWEILRELSLIALARGDAASASALRAQAGRVVDWIAGSIEDEGLRASFLARPEVASVLGPAT
jgi:tetratricopeptide (TPR) repeat protein